MSFPFIPSQLLICIVGRNHGEPLMAVAKAAGARGGTIAYGRTLSENRLICALSLGDIHQEVMLTLMGEESDAVVSAICAAAAKEPKKYQGIAILMDVAGMMARTPSPDTECTAEMTRTESTETGRKQMKSDHQLITIIVNHGFADDVMAIVRKAGATGGTIMNARGTGTAEDVKFFGISLVPEKEMLFVVAENERVAAILQAVEQIPNLCQPGGGIAYTMDVEKLIRLGGCKG
ncbi:P-II family nitrogen regulator [Desulfosarcina sp. OttesenSCG-928-A07]|nr:P-II family nitrogen regulator [Desulfosarcina sp. OttesenSCG-928-G17]MDL2330192.1 P-II family nitrogen regulator [Desulfosarcina sp. OttesenSCG-928-A07]